MGYVRVAKLGYNTQGWARVVTHVLIEQRAHRLEWILPSGARVWAPLARVKGVVESLYPLDWWSGRAQVGTGFSVVGWVRGRAIAVQLKKGCLHPGRL